MISRARQFYQHPTHPDPQFSPQKSLPNVFLSLSSVINHKHSNLKKLIATCSPTRLLTESDYNNVDMCTPQVLQILELMAEVKGWRIEDEWVEDLEEAEWGAVRRLAENWKTFKRGDHSPPTGSKRSRRKVLLDSNPEAL